MSKKSEFIKYVRELRAVASDEVLISEEAQAYWDALCSGADTSKPTFTDNGKLIMKYLQELPDGTPPMKAKDIAEGMFIGSRAVSGAMRKLVTDGYVEKIGENPVMYSITDAGKEVIIED